jgi:glycerol uptake facilitator protein
MATILISETIGTMLLILLGDGVVANVLLNKTKGQSSGWIVITTAWAFAVFVGVFASVALGGSGHLNPAVTVGLALNGNITWGDSIYYFIGEFLGAMIGALLVYLHYFPHWKETADPGLKLAVFSTGPAIRTTVWNLVSEIIGTFALMFGVFMIQSPNIGSLNALPVALLVWVIGLALGGTTGYAINPARDLGPRIMHAILPIPGKGSSDWGYSWIPVVGPVIGAVLGYLVFILV